MGKSICKAQRRIASMRSKVRNGRRGDQEGPEGHAGVDQLRAEIAAHSVKCNHSVGVPQGRGVALEKGPFLDSQVQNIT